MTAPHRSGAAPLGRTFAPTITLVVAVVLGLVLGACAAGGTPATSRPTGGLPTAAAGPSDGAGDPTGSSGDIGPGAGDSLVVPKPGQLDVHPIPADAFSAGVDGRRVVLTITYTSGVEPCSILDTVIVQRGEGSFAVTLREGHGPGNEICIMIAKTMRTQIDLGELDPGTYTITDSTGGADPIQVVVS